MEIIHYFDAIDRQWLLALNNDYPAFWDNIMWSISSKLIWIPFYLSILYVVVKHWKKESWYLVMGLILCIAIADQISSGILKETVRRLRPSRDPALENLVVIVKGYKGGMYGFVSSHSANAFGLAMLSSLLFKNKAYTFAAFFWAALVAYSRIFLGVHYPGDVLGGAVVGLVSAIIIYWALQKIPPSLFKGKYIPKKDSNIPIWTILTTVAFILIYSSII
ncbi:MAG: phosphatase PAP2 family protein [Paludibacteraceae bacterium]